MMKTAMMAGVAAWMLACSTSPGELERHSKAAQPCRPGDTCSVLPATPCTCAIAVNTRHIEALQTRAAKIDCEDAPVKQCPEASAEAQCVDDRCAFEK